MDFNSIKSQVSDKAKDELLKKVDEVKEDITKKFGVQTPETTSAAPSTPDIENAAHIEQSATEAESAEITDTADANIQGNDAGSEDTDKKEEEAA